MKGKIIPIIVFLLFTFSILDVVFGLQQSVITDLQKKLKTLGYYMIFPRKNGHTVRQL